MTTFAAKRRMPPIWRTIVRISIHDEADHRLSYGQMVVSKFDSDNTATSGETNDRRPVCKILFLLKKMSKNIGSVILYHSPGVPDTL
jgi:hypothetical protein